MVAAREGRDIFGRYNARHVSLEIQYEDVIEAIDWNRVLIQAYGEHSRAHGTEPNPICGQCIKSVLLRKEE